MALLANLGLFFAFYLPLTFAVGLPGDFYVGRYQAPEEEAALFYWIVVGWPLILPSVVALPAAHIALAVARRARGDFDRKGLRRIAAVAIPLSFLAVHLWIWGAAVLSVPLLVSILIPGTLLGLVVRIPRSTPRRPTIRAPSKPRVTAAGS